ncbi:MAG: hypothetical protein AAB475_00630 [Patescibacteria group bacterium]
MTSIFSFAVAFIAIVGMIAFKNWEIKAGKTILRNARFKADKVVVEWFIALKSHIPTKGKHLSKEITHHTAYHISHFALGGVKFAERKLIRVINFIKGKGVVNKNGNASHYLKNVSKYERHSDRK